MGKDSWHISELMVALSSKVREMQPPSWLQTFPGSPAPALADVPAFHVSAEQTWGIWWWWLLGSDLLPFHQGPPPPLVMPFPGVPAW